MNQLTGRSVKMMTLRRKMIKILRKVMKIKATNVTNVYSLEKVKQGLRPTEL